MQILDSLAVLRSHGGARTTGLDDDTLVKLADSYPELITAVERASKAYQEIKKNHPDLLDLDENAQIAQAQSGFINFYAADSVNPYIALAAAGPWIVTLKGAVLHDSGGYGMLGFGHTPQAVLEGLAQPEVTANIMTPNIAQLDFYQALKKEIGQTIGQCPYHGFICLNSGSESVSLASRIVDINAKTMTDKEGRHAGKTIKRLALKGSFHGRTDRPALYSDSSRANYVKHLASYREETSVITITPYHLDELQKAFDDADKNGWFIEAMYIEPVMGEGNPGRSVPRDFYDLARKLTKEHGSLLLIDSIQAGLRASGYLSFVDYPQFRGAEAPDMETFSKAINAGQYPLSVLALTEESGKIYQRGLYGNTMTANPRALKAACTVLSYMNDSLRQNIAQMGEAAVAKLNVLKDELGGAITNVQGTGLLFSCELAKEYKAYGEGSVEEWLRERGIGVIHGGENSLRFTPHFGITEAELDLVMTMVKKALTQK